MSRNAPTPEQFMNGQVILHAFEVRARARGVYYDFRDEERDQFEAADAWSLPASLRDENETLFGAMYERSTELKRILQHNAGRTVQVVPNPEAEEESARYSLAYVYDIGGPKSELRGKLLSEMGPHSHQALGIEYSHLRAKQQAMVRVIADFSTKSQVRLALL